MYLIPRSEDALIMRDTASVHHLYPAQHSSVPAPGQPHTPLQARLSLKFVEDGGATRLTERDHFGPLIVQKPLYPEGREICQVVIVHPPGGVVGGDQMEIAAKVGVAGKAQLTTPGAAKWYKANGNISRQNITLDVGSGGSLEWLPQETIFFDNAHVELEHSVTLGKEASYIGCEILCFGRTASGESFNGGQICQRIGIRRDGKLIWYEQLRLSGGSPAMRNPLLLAGRTVCATLIAAGPTVSAAVLEAAREGAAGIAVDGGEARISQLKGLVVARYLGNSSQTARRVMLDVWSHLRPEMLGRKAVVPRIWNT
ncbi:urease accessory protein UreD [Nitrosovibrio tenuis]|uniref:Urease accessory protein UreD n=1 Tax=Nitrosovibrio tenuis TaxID=1233 RepID=A0A1H7I9A9_9PROT|nr:urease accessory protein UreD [Nitrosovibrio tenuis]SEK59153.1 urease accessory protein [Nitrosovibrio tenuis]